MFIFGAILGAMFTCFTIWFLEIAVQEITDLNFAEYIKRTSWFIFIGSFTLSLVVILT